MSTRLPPLVSIRAFDATSRQLSVSKAAAELHVTPAAISHQIKELELFLGKTLFNRKNRRMTLTDDGKKYAEYVQQAFQYLHKGTQQLIPTTNKSLSLNVTPSFEIYWLILNLPDFYIQNPDIQINISTHECGPENINNGDIDIAILWGQGIHTAFHSELLILNKMIPVCSPQLLKGEHPLKKPSDLKHTKILYEKNTECLINYSHWSQWLKKAKLEDGTSFKKMFFENSYMLVPAAIAGHGVALVPEILARPSLLQGALVQPFNIYLKEITTGYHIVTQRHSRNNEAISAFILWIKSKMPCEKSTRVLMRSKPMYLPQVIDSTPGSLYWKDLNGRYLGCNNEMVDTSKLNSTAEIVGKTDFDLWPSIAKKLIKNDNLVISTNVTLNIEEKVILPDGKIMYFSSVKTPLKDDDGIIIGVIGNSFVSDTPHSAISSGFVS